MTQFIKQEERIRLFEDGYEILIDSEDFDIRIRDLKPGSLQRDGDYGYTSS